MSVLQCCDSVKGREMQLQPFDFFLCLQLLDFKRHVVIFISLLIIVYINSHVQNDTFAVGVKQESDIFHFIWTHIVDKMKCRHLQDGLLYKPSSPLN